MSFITTPGVRWLGKRIPRQWFFLHAKFVVAANLAFVPAQSRKSLRAVSEVLRAKFDQDKIEQTGRRYLLAKKWRRRLLVLWSVWAERHEEWFEFIGEEHLTAALGRRKGAVLLSPHSFGFGRFVAPVLAQKGYVSSRTGLGWQGSDISERWGKERYESWQPIQYRWDSWKNVAALRAIKAALSRNGVVHLSLQGKPAGEPRFEIPFWYERYFLDGQLLRAIEYFQAPVIPCFSRVDSEGKVIVQLDEPITPQADEIAAIFGRLYLRWLEKYPELSRIWRRVQQRRQDW